MAGRGRGSGREGAGGRGAAKKQTESPTIPSSAVRQRVRLQRVSKDKLDTVPSLVRGHPGTGKGGGKSSGRVAARETTESPTMSSPERGLEVESRVSLRKAKAPIRYESIEDEPVKENVVQRKRKTLKSIEKPVQPQAKQSNGKSSYLIKC